MDSAILLPVGMIALSQALLGVVSSKVCAVSGHLLNTKGSGQAFHA